MTDFCDEKRIKENYWWLLSDRGHEDFYPDKLPHTMRDVIKRTVDYAMLNYDRHIVERVYMVEQQLAMPDWTDLWAYGKLNFHGVAIAIAPTDGVFYPVGSYGFEPEAGIRVVHIRFDVDLSRHNPTDMIVKCEHHVGSELVKLWKRVELIGFMDNLHNEEMDDIPLIRKLAKERATAYLESNEPYLEMLPKDREDEWYR